MKEVDVDKQKEHKMQTRYLEDQIQSLKKKLEKEAERHKQDNMRIMKENVELISQISILRGEVGKLQFVKRYTDMLSKGGTNPKKPSTLTSSKGPTPRVQTQEESMRKELEMQRDLIGQYKRRIEDLQV